MQKLADCRVYYFVYASLTKPAESGFGVYRIVSEGGSLHIALLFFVLQVFSRRVFHNIEHRYQEPAEPAGVFRTVRQGRFIRRCQRLSL